MLPGGEDFRLILQSQKVSLKGGVPETFVEISISKGQHRLSYLETKLERQGGDGLDLCREVLLYLISGSWCSDWTKHLGELLLENLCFYSSFCFGYLLSLPLHVVHKMFVEKFSFMEKVLGNDVLLLLLSNGKMLQYSRRPWALVWLKFEQPPEAVPDPTWTSVYLSFSLLWSENSISRSVYIPLSITRVALQWTCKSSSGLNFISFLFVPSADCHHFRLLFNSLSFVFLCHSDDMKLKSYFTSLGSIILAQNVQGQASLLFCAFCICKNYISPNMFQI